VLSHILGKLDYKETLRSRMVDEHQEKTPMGGTTPLLITKMTAQPWK